MRRTGSSPATAALRAAKRLGIKTVPTVRLEGLSEAEVRAYVIADNRLAELADWDDEILAIELQALVALDFAVEVTGFETAEIDLLIDGLEAPGTADEGDRIPMVDRSASRVAQVGDLWLLGRHRLLCGDATQEESYKRLMAGEPAQMVFTDPPYNVPVDGHVCGLGRIRHAEFAMASRRDVGGRIHGFPGDCARPPGGAQRRRRAALRLHGLAARIRTAVGRARDVQRDEESVRLEQDQRRHGFAVPLAARARVRLQERLGAARQQCRARAATAATAPTSGSTPA